MFRSLIWKNKFPDDSIGQDISQILSFSSDHWLMNHIVLWITIGVDVFNGDPFARWFGFLGSQSPQLLAKVFGSTAFPSTLDHIRSLPETHTRSSLWIPKSVTVNEEVLPGDFTTFCGFSCHSPGHTDEWVELEGDPIESPPNEITFKRSPIS